MIKKTLFKAILLLFIIIALPITFPIFLGNSIILAQQPTSEDKIPSDLSLDLNLAQQNPAPDQQVIVSSETKQAEIVTNTGDITTVKPEDKLATEVKIESAKNAINPQQTTSEQVITTPVTVEVDQNGTPVPTNIENQPSTSPNSQPGATNNPSPSLGNPSDTAVPTGTTNNLVPGTSVTQPDDNAAPEDNSTNPSLTPPTSPAPTSGDNSSVTITPSSSTQESVSPPSSPASPQNGTQNTNQGSSDSQQNQQSIPLESQPQANPTTNNTDQTQQQPSQAPQAPSDNNPPASDNSQQSTQTSTEPQPTSDTSGATPAVQGAATGPNILQRVWSKFMYILGK